MSIVYQKLKINNNKIVDKVSEILDIDKLYSIHFVYLYQNKN